MNDAAEEQPIIIKKIIKKGGHGGHHGGAWKVAYADFVTAMMALFMLLWLLNVDPSTKVVIADFFREPTKEGPIEGRKFIFGGSTKPGQPGKLDGGASFLEFEKIQVNRKNQAQVLQTLEEEFKREIQDKSGDDEEKARGALNKVSFDITDKGILIEVKEENKGPLFKSGSEVLSEGSVSYLIENTFDRTLGEFCSAR